MKRILHIVVDDKFIDMAIREFEAVAPDTHEYVMLNGKNPYTYVRNANVHNITETEFVGRVQSSDISAVVFHCLTPDKYPLLEAIPTSKKVFWLGWGFDYYEALLSRAYTNGLLAPRTQKLDQPPLGRRLYRSTRSNIRRTLQWAGVYPTYDCKLLERVDYFIPVLDVEYHLACKHNSWFRPKYITWNYGTVEDDMTISEMVSIRLGDNLLVGNSSTPTCNHLETFEIIGNQVDLTHRKVIVPLSYGDPVYRDKILKLGNAILGKHFFPLIKFMPKDEYIPILASCGYVMMNHLRQQALGNICISALMGAKIFLNQCNPLYNWLLDKGVIVWDIENPHLEPLTNSQHRINIEAIRRNWGRSVQREKTRQLINLALS